MTCGLHIGDLISYGTVEVGMSLHGDIVFLCDNKQILNPTTMLSFTSEFSGALATL